MTKLLKIFTNIAKYRNLSMIDHDTIIMIEIGIDSSLSWSIVDCDNPNFQVFFYLLDTNYLDL